MRKVWRLSVVSQHKHIVDFHIEHVETDIENKESETYQTPGGAFDSVALQVLRLQDKDNVYKVISNMYKQKFSFSSDAKITYKKYFYEAKHKRPDYFI